ncbi:predicted protein [Culex quinquefasciatus]|uniref:Predicted protein n=1 Tax=Culex quinquefasciatus TaxID=7176 RepID=B0WZP9_CULQU|nr:predicted protein [Culex quinquefasciatus]|eukprot:XP_001862871.1 predicted protein [Culex quinquefasciatus]
MDFGKLGRNFLLVDAIIRKQLHEVDSLLNSGADIDFINYLDKNNTPLHYAAFADAPDIKEFLLSKGANPDSTNDEGISPFELNATGEDSSLQSVKLDSNEPAFSATYIKRPGTSAISGQLYETKLLALALFRLVHDSQIPSFYLGTNLDEAGAFDDVVLRYRIGGRDRVLFLQAKHKEDCSKKIALKDLLDPDKTSGNFNLGKYFRSYLQIRYKFSANSASAVFNGDFEKTNAELILFTSAAMDTSLGSSAELVVKSEQTARTCLFYSVPRGNTISFEGFPKSFVKVASQWHFEAMAEVVIKRLMLSKKCDDLRKSVEQLLEDEAVLAKLKSLEDYTMVEANW